MIGDFSQNIVVMTSIETMNKINKTKKHQKKYIGIDGDQGGVKLFALITY